MDQKQLYKHQEIGDINSVIYNIYGKEVAEGDEILMALNETIYEYINDAKTKEIFQNWQDYIYEQQAREEERNSIAKMMLKKEMKLEDISEITGLSLAELENLKKND